MTRPLSRPVLFGVPPSPPRKRISGAIPSEMAEQRMVAQYLDARRMLWLHVPNEGKRNPVTGSILRGLGLKRGAPDILVFTPPKGGAVVGCAIELKRRKGGAATPEQLQWLEALKAHGWSTAVCFGADDAIAHIKAVYGG